MILFSIFYLLFTQTKSQFLSNCLNDREYIFIEDFLTYESAKSNCLTFNGVPNLAIIKEQETLDFINEFINDIFTDFDFKFFWFGLERFVDTDPTNPLTFEFVDGTTFNPGFGDINNVSPWRDEEPNNSGGLENCGEVFIDGSGIDFNDASCTLFKPSLCERQCTRTVSQCFQGSEFIFIDDPFSFDDAQVQCTALNANLASITDQATRTFVDDFILSDRNDENSRFWIGLRRFIDDDPLDPRTFSFIDGSSFSGFGETAGVSPWRIGEPSNGNFNENCVEADFFNNNFADWNDLNCNTLIRSVCERPCSTDNPTTNPTTIVTLSPTSSPSRNPSKNNPSTSPTKIIVSPTKNPVQLLPTSAPTSIKPTQTPSFSPTARQNSTDLEESLKAEGNNLMSIILLLAIGITGLSFFVVVVRLFYKIKEFSSTYTT